jgi:hypothetical protein
MVALTEPLVGALSGPQSTNEQVGAAPDHVPSGWQVRVTDCDRRYPIEQA